MCDDLAASDVDGDGNSSAVYIQNRRQCQFRLENVIVSLFLPTVVADTLAKVTVAIKQTDRCQRQIEIACRFEMIACQDAEAAGIIWQGIVDAVFGTEIGDGDVF